MYYQKKIFYYKILHNNEKTQLKRTQMVSYVT